MNYVERKQGQMADVLLTQIMVGVVRFWGQELWWQLPDNEVY